MTCAACGWPYTNIVSCCPRIDPAGLDLSAVPSARLQHDLTAAFRAAVAATGALPPGLPAAAKHCRGWVELEPADQALHLQAARKAVAARRAAVAEAAELVEPVRSGIARLVSGIIERLVLVRVAADGLSWCSIDVGDEGEPVVAPVSGVLDTWTELLPSDAAGDRRLYLLAGGGAKGPWWCSPETVARQAEIALREFGADGPAAEYLLLRGDPDLWMVDVLAASLRGRVMPAADLRVDGATLPDVLAHRWTVCAPLRRGYDLVCATVEGPVGDVRPILAPLFRAGVEPGWGVPREVTFTVDAVDGRPGQVCLPVLSGVEVQSNGSIRPEASVVTAATIDVDGPTSVRFELQAPGVVLVDDRPARPSGPAGVWADLAHRLPLHQGYDVAIAIELCGPEEKVRDRLRILQGVVAGMVLRERSTPGAVRMAALGYRDHGVRLVPRPGRDPLGSLEERTVTATSFVSPEALSDEVIAWTPVEQQTVWGTALEDALHTAVDLGWEPGRLSSLIVIGSRPPAARRAGSTYVDPCPNGIDWETQVTHLATRNVRTLVVHDEPNWPQVPGVPRERTRWVWAALAGAGGPWPLTSLSITSLVEAVVPGSIAPVRLCRLISGG